MNVCGVSQELDVSFPKEVRGTFQADQLNTYQLCLTNVYGHEAIKQLSELQAVRVQHLIQLSSWLALISINWNHSKRVQQRLVEPCWWRHAWAQCDKLARCSAVEHE